MSKFTERHAYILNQTNYHITIARFVDLLIFKVLFCLRLQKDPFGTAGSLSSTEREAYKNISLPRLNEILPTLVENQLTIMFDLQITNTSHPFYHNQTIVIEEEFVKANVDPKKVIVL